MRFYLELLTNYGAGHYCYLCVYVSRAHARGEAARIVGFRLMRDDSGRLQFQTFPALRRLRRPRLRTDAEFRAEMMRRMGRT